MFCPLSRNHSDPGNTRRTPTDKAGRELYALMRDQFDRYVYIWEASIAWKPIGCPYAWVTSGSNLI